MKEGGLDATQQLIKLYQHPLNQAVKRDLLPFNRWSVSSNRMPRVEFRLDKEWFQNDQLESTLDKIENELRSKKEH